MAKFVKLDRLPPYVFATPNQTKMDAGRNADQPGRPRDPQKHLEAVSKHHLTPNNGVVALFKILTYSHVCSVFSSVHALFLGAI